MKESDYASLQAFLHQGGSLRMLADTDPKDLNILYRYGTQLMNYSDYEGAKRIFYLLMKIDQWNFDYFFSLGTSCQQLGEHEEAIFCFGRSGIINVEDPRSPYYAGKSYHAVGNIDYAVKSYKAAIRVCDCLDEDKWTDIADQSRKALAKLTQEACYDQ
ncbi:CesD/SycD/LcrH family type III secretion system chaperone [Vibrio hepatarius]|uniref:CesD/SycD/LcrH family type III secretion system chaperone n=1 Tax=Vibrio hepatarius TaxID=171383 RepID=UPI001C09F6AB|nr:CesD/SycD/LcrH family type III secretion system chaperone [Vibrio hepatarius]MBU2898921.1 CesD/SycD/LcrH family type III secretion system chaperone [Vibrio hepatarius]